MTTTTVDGAPAQTSAATALVEIAVPVYNEEAELSGSVHRLHRYLTDYFPFAFRITVVDNASTDRTWRIAQRLASELPGVSALRLAEKGRGRALRAVWVDSDADVVAYMDVDLSTDLAALLPLVAPLLSGHSDLAVGTRLSHSARVVRGAKRELISRSYNAVLHATLATKVSDAQCGFKAIRADVARVLLPHVKDDEWFFDTELLVLAERAGMRVSEVPVDWVDDLDSRVDIVTTAINDLRGVARVRRALVTGRLPIGTLQRQLSGDAPEGDVDAGGVPPRPSDSLLRQVASFAVVGVVSTIAFALLYAVLRGVMSAHWANGAALLATAVANTEANRRLTFGVRSRTGRLRQHVHALGVFALSWAVTSVALAGLHATTASPAATVELIVLIVAGLVATVLRFILLRSWVFRHPPKPARRITIPSFRTATAPALTPGSES